VYLVMRREDGAQRRERLGREGEGRRKGAGLYEGGGGEREGMGGEVTKRVISVCMYEK